MLIAFQLSHQDVSDRKIVKLEYCRKITKDYFFLLSTKNDFLRLFARIWIKAQFPLVVPTTKI